MSYTLTTALSTGTAGQTVTAQLVDTAGANVGGAVSTGFVDLGAGFYEWTYASFPDGFRGVVKFLVSGVVQDVTAINPQEGEYLDAKVSTRAATGITQVAVSAPVAEDLRVEIGRNEDYQSVDGRQLVWSAEGWPDLTGATITFTAKWGSNSLVESGTVVSASADPEDVQVVGVEVDAVDTAALQVGTYRYYLQAALGNGDVIMLVRSTLRLLEDATL